MSTDDEQWPPEPKRSGQTETTPAQPSGWMALCWSVIGSACLALLTRFNLFSQSEIAWSLVFVGVFAGLPVAIIRGVKSYRSWQGMLALIISAACVGWIVYSLCMQPFTH